MRNHPMAAADSAAATSFWDRNGWKLLLVLVVVIGLFGIGDVVRGMDADPAIPVGVAGMAPEEMRQSNPPLARLVDLQVRSGGLHLLMLAAVWTAVLLVPYRRRERWAWWVMWTYPFWSLAVAVSFLFVELAPGESVPPPAISGWVLGGLTGGLLLASRRQFFNR